MRNLATLGIMAVIGLILLGIGVLVNLYPQISLKVCVGILLLFAFAIAFKLVRNNIVDDILGKE